MNFFRDLWSNLSAGWLLFGGPIDVVRMVLDILVTAFVIHFVLRLMANTRAWQLFKGIIFIFVFTFVCDLLGLQTISWLLRNSISVLAIGLVVIFQPELRRALETVGRTSMRFFSTAAPEDRGEMRSIHNIIESIVIACERMSASYTGALILIERQTKLGELIQGTTVMLDAALTSTALEQIFYKGSPLHDGAVIIRGDRILAARTHVPLSDNYHMRRDYGTRHRAAVGASEIGDTLAIVCSEERGSISVAIGGRLYPIKDGDALRSVLHRALEPADNGDKKRSGKTLREAFLQEEDVEGVVGSQSEDEVRQQRRLNFLLRLASVIIAAGLWFYVQLDTNPLNDVRLSDIPVEIVNEETLDNGEMELTFTRPENTTSIHIQVRETYIDQVSRENLVATIDFATLDGQAIIDEIRREGSSPQKLTIVVTVEGLNQGAYRVVSRIPDVQTVTFVAEAGGENPAG